MVIFFIHLVTPLEECQREEAPNDIPCFLVTGWSPSGSCDSYNATIYSSNGTQLYNQTFGTIGDTGRCNVTFNQTSVGQYYANSSIDTWNVLVKQEDNMTSLGVIIFLILLNIALFALPFFVRFTNNEITNHIIRYIIFILGWTILTFNTTILATLADTAGLGITHELFVFQWFFLKAIYIFMLFLFLKMLIMVPKLLNEKRTKERMGDDE